MMSGAVHHSESDGYVWMSQYLQRNQLGELIYNAERQCLQVVIPLRVLAHDSGYEVLGSALRWDEVSRHLSPAVSVFFGYLMSAESFSKTGQDSQQSSSAAERQPFRVGARVTIGSADEILATLDANQCRFCSRLLNLFWREVWLERV